MFYTNWLQKKMKEEDEGGAKWIFCAYLGIQKGDPNRKLYVI